MADDDTTSVPTIGPTAAQIATPSLTKPSPVVISVLCSPNQNYPVRRSFRIADNTDNSVNERIGPVGNS